MRPGSYAAEIVQRIYESYVEGSIDVKVEFARYYRPEYRSVYGFLYDHYGCDEGDIQALSRESASDHVIRLVEEPPGRDYNIGSLIGRVEGAERALFPILNAEWV